SSDRGPGDSRGGAPGVPAAACGGGVSAAPVLAYRASRGRTGSGAGRGGRRGGGADLWGPRTAAPGRECGTGGAGCSAGGRNNGRVARTGDAHGAGGGEGEDGDVAVPLGGGAIHGCGPEP